MALVSDRTVDGLAIASLKPNSYKRVRVKCDECGKVTETTYQNYCHAQEKRGWSGKTSCKACAARRTLREAQRQAVAAQRGKPRPNQRREQHSRWKGGRYMSHDGYVMIHVTSDTTHTGWAKYAKEHIVIAEGELGRKLEKGEVIHHIDGVKTNNTWPDNLHLTTAVQHRFIHWSLMEIGFELVRAGYITFDRDNERYVAERKLRELLGLPGEANQQPSPDREDWEGSETRRETQ